MSAVVIYTDGACSGNPGPGGWGAVLIWNGVVKELSGGELYTTNQRMELTAVIKALEALKRPCEVIVRTDSQYLVNTMTQGWKRRANLDLWGRLDELCRVHKISWEWVRGHAGDPYNELADRLARAAIPQKEVGSC